MLQLTHQEIVVLLLPRFRNFVIFAAVAQDAGNYHRAQSQGKPPPHFSTRSKMHCVFRPRVLYVYWIVDAGEISRESKFAPLRDSLEPFMTCVNMWKVGSTIFGLRAHIISGHLGRRRFRLDSEKISFALSIRESILRPLRNFHLFTIAVGRILAKWEISLDLWLFKFFIAFCFMSAIFRFWRLPKKILNTWNFSSWTFNFQS